MKDVTVRDGSSVVADRVAEAIIQGDTLAAALTLAESLADLTDPQTLAAIVDAITNLPDLLDPETAVTQLLSIPGILASDTVGDADSGQAVGTLDASAPTESHATAQQSAVKAAKPDQYDNGEPKAENSFRWQHHGSEHVKIYLERTDRTGTHPDGYILENYAANTFFTPDMRLIDSMGPGSIDVTFSHYSAKLKRDINGLPDTTQATYNCPTGGWAYLQCSGSANAPTNNSNWYYEQVNFRMTYGADVADVQIQTRRAQQNSVGGLTFPIAATGG